MPAVNYAKKEDIPAEQVEAALKLEDGTYVVFEDIDTAELDTALADERKLRKTAETNASTAARKLKALEGKKKGDDVGVDEDTRQQIREEARQELLDEKKDELESGQKAAEENRLLKSRTHLQTIALGKIGGVRKERFDAFYSLYGDEFELTADGKGIVVKGKPGVDPAKHIQAMKARAGVVEEFWEGTKAAGGGAQGGAAGGAAGSISFEDLAKHPGRGLQIANEQGAKA